MKKLEGETFLQTALQITKRQKKGDTENRPAHSPGAPFTCVSDDCFARQKCTVILFVESGGDDRQTAISKAFPRTCANERKRAVSALHAVLELFAQSLKTR